MDACRSVKLLIEVSSLLSGTHQQTLESDARVGAYYFIGREGIEEQKNQCRSLRPLAADGEGCNFVYEIKGMIPQDLR